MARLDRLHATLLGVLAAKDFFPAGLLCLGLAALAWGWGWTAAATTLFYGAVALLLVLPTILIALGLLTAVALDRHEHQK